MNLSATTPCALILQVLTLTKTSSLVFMCILCGPSIELVTKSSVITWPTCASGSDVQVECQHRKSQSLGREGLPKPALGLDLPLLGLQAAENSAEEQVRVAGELAASQWFDCPGSPSYLFSSALSLTKHAALQSPSEMLLGHLRL